MSKSWDFPVKTYPIVVHRQGEYLTFPKRIAVVREDSRKPIAIASDRYGLLLHKDVVKTFREAFGPKEEIQEQFKMSKDGARMHYEVTLPNVLVEVSPGDKMAMRLIVENSYDSSHRLQVVFGAFRLVCENGLVIGRKFLSISRKHVGEMTLEVGQIQKQVAILTAAFRDSEKEMKKILVNQRVLIMVWNLDGITVHQLSLVSSVMTHQLIV